MNTKRSMFGEANLALCGATLGLVLLAPSAIAATTDAAAMQLASKYNCQTCHTVDKKTRRAVVQGSRREVRRRQGGARQARGEGQAGRQRRLGPDSDAAERRSEADLKSLVEWILALE